MEDLIMLESLLAMLCGEAEYHFTFLYEIIRAVIN